MSWSSVRILPSNAEGRDAIVAALFTCGAQAVVEEGSAIVTHFPQAENLTELRAAVLRADPGASLTSASILEEDWSIAWRTSLKAHDLGGLTVTPPWLAQGLDPRRTIVIDPGMAFGTGDHESTRGVLKLLPMAVHAEDTVADLGSGSGVLAIAAAKLGARRVYAIESDSDAIANAVANVRDNGVSGRVHVLEGDAKALLPLVAPVGVVLANIISSVLEQLLPAIETSLSTRGRAILSGLLLTERRAWQELLTRRGWQVFDEHSEGDWWTVAIHKT